MQNPKPLNTVTFIMHTLKLMEIIIQCQITKKNSQIKCLIKLLIELNDKRKESTTIVSNFPR